MGLRYISDEKIGLLINKKNGFYAESTGCGCCSNELKTKEDVEKEIIDSLSIIIRAFNYFNFARHLLYKKAEDLIEKQNAEELKAKKEKAEELMADCDTEARL